MKFNVPISEVVSIVESAKPEWTKANEMSLEGGFFDFDLSCAEFYRGHKFLLDMNHHPQATVSLCSKDYKDMLYVKHFMEEVNGRSS